MLLDVCCKHMVCLAVALAADIALGSIKCLHKKALQDACCKQPLCMACNLPERSEECQQYSQWCQISLTGCASQVGTHL